MRILTILVLCLLALNVSDVNAQGIKIAVVDVEQLLSSSKAGNSIQSQLTSRRESFQKEFKSRETNLMNAEKTLVEQKQSMSAEDFAAKRKDFEKQLYETRSLFQKRRNSLDKGLGNALDQLRKSIIQVTAEISEEQGFQVVLTRDSVVIVEKEMDITQAVLARLDKRMASINLDIK